jgi:TIR domain
MASRDRIGEIRVSGHVFLCYAPEDSQRVDRLHRVLDAAGIPVWRDEKDLWPGQDWRAEISHSITNDTVAFIVCFSRNSISQRIGRQNEELRVAMEQLGQRSLDTTWLIPTRLDDCEIPRWEIGAGRTLASIQHADLFSEHYDENIARLVATVLRVLWCAAGAACNTQDRTPSSTAVTAAGVNSYS